MKESDFFKKVISHAKEYGYIFPCSEIYDGLSAVYDYGQNGVELKKNLREYWWRAMVQLNDNIVGIDAAILMHPTTWKASGHVDAFSDPLIDNKDSKKRYRADVLIEEYVSKIEDKIEKEVQKAAEKFGAAFDREQFVGTNARVLEHHQKAAAIIRRMSNALSNNDLADVKALIDELQIADPETGSRNWTEVRQFNLMFGTEIGASADSTMKLYLRPETAQGIFVNFLNVQKTSRQKIPFGIAQVGKAFRNEIVARQFIFRMREFEQMEMQFFIRPGSQKQWYDHWKKQRMKWHLAIGLGENNYRWHDHEKLAHYADAACDIEYHFPFGFKELEGIHSRTDFDLGNHEKYSSKNLKYFDPELNESYVPYVVETSIGLDRLFLAVFSNALCEESLSDGTSRVVLKIPDILAPYKVAVLPLLKKDGLPELARSIADDLRFDFMVNYDEKDAIGKRYRRQDAIGTPFCVTIDHQTLEDHTVTVRHRDSMAQERMKADALKTWIDKRVSMSQWLSKLK